MADDSCSDLRKTLGTAQRALVIAVENAQVLPDLIDFDELSDEDAAIYSAVENAQDRVEQAEDAFNDCEE